MISVIIYYINIRNSNNNIYRYDVERVSLGDTAGTRVNGPAELFRISSVDFYRYHNIIIITYYPQDCPRRVFCSEYRTFVSTIFKHVIT